MDQKFDFGAEQGERIVYVRKVGLDELPAALRKQLDDDQPLYAVHSEDGERLALVRDRQLAFVLARQNDLVPVTVH